MKKVILDKFKDALMPKKALKTTKGGYPGTGCCTLECRDVHGQTLGYVSIDKTCDNTGSICYSFYPQTWMSYCTCS